MKGPVTRLFVWRNL